MAAMDRRRPEDVMAWLDGRPSLSELQAAFPDEWTIVQREVAGVVAGGDLERLKAYAASLPEAAPSRRVRRAIGEKALLDRRIRREMAAAAVRQLALSAATGVTEGRVRFNLLNGWIAQRLLFESDLRRKPVSLFWFRLLWPLLWQRRFLMPLVGRQGIYCFYSQALIERLAALIGDRRCLEIAAGDGTLSRFLSDAGVAITATDSYEWRESERFPETVLRQGAVEALAAHRPEVVICSWPPAGNAFESAVFRTESVQLYIVISSRHQFAAGNWQAYGAQTEFSFAEELQLSELVLPPELDGAVYLFNRAARRGSDMLLDSSHGVMGDA